MIASFININTLEECFQYINPDYPLRVFSDIDEYVDLSEYPLHWHNEVEIACVLSGNATFYINSAEYFLEKGDVIFINSKVFHKTKYSHDSPFQQKGVLFSSELLQSPIGTAINYKYILPIVNNKSLDAIVFRKNTTSAQKIIEIILNINEIFFALPQHYELETRIYLSKIWMILLDNVPKNKPANNSSDTLRMRKMITYINANYDKRIGLTDIASAANISDRECSRCFQRVLGKTPINYLNSFRINAAKELLSSTDMTISEIANATGFVSNAYFTSVFKKTITMSPSEYRKSCLK